MSDKKELIARKEYLLSYVLTDGEVDYEKLEKLEKSEKHIEFFNEFFSFPENCLFYDYLNGSIKENKEITLTVLKNSKWFNYFSLPSNLTYETDVVFEVAKLDPKILTKIGAEWRKDMNLIKHALKHHPEQLVDVELLNSRRNLPIEYESFVSGLIKNKPEIAEGVYVPFKDFMELYSNGIKAKYRESENEDENNQVYLEMIKKKDKSVFRLYANNMGKVPWLERDDIIRTIIEYLPTEVDEISWESLNNQEYLKLMAKSKSIPGVMDYCQVNQLKDTEFLLDMLNSICDSEYYQKEKEGFHLQAEEEGPGGQLKSSRNIITLRYAHYYKFLGNQDIRKVFTKLTGIEISQEYDSTKDASIKEYQEALAKGFKKVEDLMKVLEVETLKMIMQKDLGDAISNVKVVKPKKF